MQATDNDQVIERYLNEMLQRIGDGNANLLEVKEQISNLQITYQAEREAAKKDPSKEKAFERYQEALAGALPGVAKGTLESISAFQKSPPDVIVGSAAVMDVCASLASTLGGLTAAGGPPGALLGALFSTVSMILRFFAPQPPSLLSQIEEMMRTLRAETVASQIEAARDAVLAYIAVCDKYMPPLEKDKPVPDPTRLTELVNDLNLIRGDEIWTIREVRKWLDEPKNQDLEGWPEILNLVCQVYMFLMLALTRQNLYANDKKRVEKYIGNVPSREQQWRLLQEATKHKLVELAVNNKEQLNFLKKMLPIARKRGTFVILLGSGDVFAATGPTALQNGEWGPVIFHGCRRIAVVPAREGVDHPDPKYDFWVLQKSSKDYAFHNQLAVRSRRLEKRQSDHVGPQGQGYQWRDWWPLPNADGTFTIYAARRLEQGGEFTSYSWRPSDPSKMSPPTRYQWFGQKTPCVRVATPSADPLPGDPDGPTSLPYTLNGNKMIYGALEDSSDIWVRQEGTGSGLLHIPLTDYRGLAVDEYCVWIFGLEGLACVTHASVQSVLSGRRGAPNWLGPSKHGRSNVPQDLSACGDGTVLLYEGQLMNGLYHIDFATDPQKGLTINWELYSDLRGASQVQKLAILGWPLIDASIQSLTEPARHRVRPSFLLN